MYLAVVPFGLHAELFCRSTNMYLHLIFGSYTLKFILYKSFPSEDKYMSNSHCKCQFFCGLAISGARGCFTKLGELLKLRFETSFLWM